MGKAVKQFQVDIATNPSALTITAEPIASNAKITIQCSQIVSVTPIYFNYGAVENNNTGQEFKETYPYGTMTRLIIELENGTKLDWELQAITNQPTWSTGLLTGLQAAANAINALL